MTHFNARWIRVAAFALMLAVMVTASSLAPATPAQAATCGGAIVYYTGTYYGADGRMHYAIGVIWYNPKGLNNIPGGLTSVTFNGQTVPNSQSGIDYTTPLKKDGTRGFYFGVSQRWVYAHWDTWRFPTRWRAYYNC